METPKVDIAARIKGVVDDARVQEPGYTIPSPRISTDDCGSVTVIRVGQTPKI